MFLIVEVDPYDEDLAAPESQALLEALCDAATIVGIPQGVTWTKVRPKNTKNLPLEGGK